MVPHIFYRHFQLCLQVWEDCVWLCMACTPYVIRDVEPLWLHALQSVLWSTLQGFNFSTSARCQHRLLVHDLLNTQCFSSDLCNCSECGMSCLPVVSHNVCFNIKNDTRVVFAFQSNRLLMLLKQVFVDHCGDM